jgi:urease gamma subunit-like protein
VHLSPHEQERPLLSYAAELDRRRRARGLRLNLPEATAIVTDHVLEGASARDGVLVAELMRPVARSSPGTTSWTASLRCWRRRPCRPPAGSRRELVSGGRQGVLSLGGQLLDVLAGALAQVVGGFGHGSSSVRFPDTGCPPHRVPE